MVDKVKSINPKTAAIRHQKLVCWLLFLSFFLSLAFVGVAFLDSFAIVSETLDHVYFSPIEMAVGIAGFELNGFLLAGLLVEGVSMIFTFVVFLASAITKRFAPWSAMLMALAIAGFAYVFAITFFFQMIITNSLSELANPEATLVTMWPIYLMSGLSGGSLAINLSLLIFTSIESYSHISIQKR
ncbi:MAG: hypothetical protein WC282_04300 [Bacilli bacterium]|jgi:hypothetical protein